MYESTVSLSIVFFCVFLQLIFEASAGDRRPLHRRLQGHIVLDNIDLGPENTNESPTSNLCTGHCNFDAGFCGWNNDDQDDFNWKLVRIVPLPPPIHDARHIYVTVLFQSKGRGSMNTATGPSRDHSTLGSNKPSRGYVFIDSGYPRRPGDKAKLVSPQMQPTGSLIN